MARVYVGNLDPRVTERGLEDEFRTFGVLRSVWVARKLPGFAFVEFEDRRDASDAIHDLNVDAHDAVRAVDGKNGWRVELSRSSGGGPRGRGGDDMKCYECGEPGHFARECRLRVGSGGLGSGAKARSRTPPRFRRSPSYGRRYSRSPLRSSLSPRRRSLSPRRGRSPPRRYDRRRYNSSSPRPALNGDSYYRARHSRSP